MDTETAIETQIEPKLIAAFGRQVANSLLTWATLGYATADGGERRRYEAFVHSICSDERAIRAWGAGGAAHQEEVWKALFGPEPGLADERGCSFARSLRAICAAICADRREEYCDRRDPGRPSDGQRDTARDR